MLLTIDVGNTNITMGVFEEELLSGMFRMTTKRPRTSDEYGMTICAYWNTGPLILGRSKPLSSHRSYLISCIH